MKLASTSWLDLHMSCSPIQLSEEKGKKSSGKSGKPFDFSIAMDTTSVISSNRLDGNVAHMCETLLE